MSFSRGRLIYEGKAKRVYEVEGEANLLWLDFKDSLTAFNAEKKGEFKGKGSLNAKIAKYLFERLEAGGVRTHFVESLSEHEMICRKMTMIPLEVVVRNVLAGSLAKKLGRPEGEELRPPIQEYFFKDDALGDPFINEDHALMLKAAESKEQLEQIRAEALKINTLLSNIFSEAGILLVDFKLEFGVDPKGDILLADEISPDSCRLWDKQTGEKLDKDRFRRDLGRVEESYKEVLNRLVNTH